MPEVPSTNGFINGGLNTRPTFFGCNDTTTPVIIYVPNYPWSSYANVSTYTLEYAQDLSLEVINNGMRSLTLNGSVPTWPTCLACALSDRAFGYTMANRTTECQNCFDTWCWNGVDNTTTPNEYEPVSGQAPAFLTERGLINGTTATGTTTETGQAPAASSSSAAGMRWKGLGEGRERGWLGGLVGVVPAVVGAGMILI